MKNKKLLTLIPVLAAVVSGGAFYYFQRPSTVTDDRQMTCLSAVIPSVVLHYEQEEIVKLLSDLAEESKEAIPEKLRPEKVKPVFSSRVDEELLKIAKYFSMSTDSPKMEQAEVMPTVNRALEFFSQDSPVFMQQCLKFLDDAEKDCGTVENPDPEEQACLEKHSDRINGLVRNQIPN